MTGTGAVLGVVADDVTGACDLAGGAVAAGLSAVVVIGPPGRLEAPAADVLVVALKSRTAPVEQAVRLSCDAGRWLLERRARWLYQKYCSTFDSTERGNIGPVADALAGLVGRHGHASGTPAMTVGTPATPVAGRTLYAGHLFVHGRLLSESSMRHHPLTPMHDPDVVRVLTRQAARPVRLMDLATVRAGVAAVQEDLRRAAAEGTGHLLVDATEDADLDTVAAALLRGATDGDHAVPLMMGGAAGLATAAARQVARRGAATTPTAALPDVAAGPRLVLAGSCSQRTREQVARFPGPAVALDAGRAHHDGAALVDELLARLRSAYERHPAPAVLVHSCATAEELAGVRSALGRDVAAAAVEQVFAAVARRAVHELGVRRLVVAGGETSGAVTAALDIHRLRVGREVSPGVPWTVSVEEPRVGLLLKSGNFGGADLFTEAWRTAP